MHDYSPLIVLAAFTLALLLYLLPTLIAAARNCRHADAIFALNLLLGWTVIGWLAMFTWALVDDKAPMSDSSRTA